MIPLEEFHLVHAITDFSVLENVIKTGKLQSLSRQKDPKSPFFSFFKTKKEDKRYIYNQYNNKVFFGLIFPDQNNHPLFSINNVSGNFVYLVFDPKMIEDYKNCSLQLVNGRKISFPLYCNEWTYGKYYKGVCKFYKKSKSLVENLNNFRTDFIEKKLKNLYKPKKGINYLYFKSVYNTTSNEIAVQFTHDMNDNCIEGEVFLKKYLQAIYVSFDYNKNFEKIHELAKKYPEYTWIFA